MNWCRAWVPDGEEVQRCDVPTNGGEYCHWHWIEKVRKEMEGPAQGETK